MKIEVYKMLHNIHFLTSDCKKNVKEKDKVSVLNLDLNSKVIVAKLEMTGDDILMKKRILQRVKRL